MRKTLTLVIVAIAFAGAGAVAFGARGPAPNARPTAAEVESRVMSPFCPGVLLADCQTRQSAGLKERIEETVASGSTNAQIDRWLVSNYGQDVLASPPGIVAWTIPALILGAGAVAILWASRRWRTEPSVDKELPVAEDDRTRVNAELARFAREQTE